MRKTGKLKAVAALALVLSFLLAGCAGGTSQADGQKTIKWAGTWTVATWDPVVGGSTRVALYNALIYDSLVGLDENGKPIPNQAESWEYNDEGNAVTFTLREGLTFTDGTPVDAAAWKFNLERAKTQENSQLKGDFDSIASVDVIDDQTFRINLSQTDYQIPILLSVRGGLIASPKAAQDDVKALNLNKPVGSGPFKVESLVPEAKLTLVKNPEYWDANNIHIDRIEVSFGNEVNSLVPAIQTGTYDFAIGDVTTIDAAKKAGVDVLADWGYGFSTQFIPINKNKEPFTDPRVVEAFKAAIDRQPFVDQLALGHGTAIDQPYPPFFAPYAKAAEGLNPYDPDKARSLLAEAGYNTTDKRLSLDFVAMQDQPVNELIQSQLAAVGVDLQIKIDPNWSKSYFAKDLAITSYGYVGRDSHVQALTANFAGGPLNLSGPYQSEEFKAALKKARETPLDSPDYKANLEAATLAGVQSNPNIYTYAVPFVYLKNSKISDLPEVLGQLSFRGVEIS